MHDLEPECLPIPADRSLQVGDFQRADGSAGLRKWSLPILTALGDQPRRFSELSNSLPGTTNRALALALKDLESAGLITRTVTTDYPPASLYGVTPTAVPLAQAAARLTVRTE